MKKVFLAFGLLFIVIAVSVFAQNYLKTGNHLPFKKNTTAVTAAINGHVFNLTIANSPKEKEIGLSETKSLPENQGMLFPFEKPGYYSFWMKDMTFPIDIIYINGQEIVTIKNNVFPPKNPTESLVIYTPLKSSDKVLEISAGLSEKYNFKKGDKVQIENL